MRDTAVSSDATAAAGAPPRRKWIGRLGLLVCVGLLVFWFRAPLLEQVALAFVVNEDPADATHVLLHSGDRNQKIAWEMFNEKSDRAILLRHAHLQRTERMGFAISHEELNRRFLLKAGVPVDRLGRLPLEGRDDWEFAESLALWMENHPTARVAVLCESLDSRKLARLLSIVLGANRQKVRVVAVPNAEYDESNWWQKKEGMLDVLRSAVRLGYFELLPRRPPPSELDDDAFARSIK